MLQWHNLSLQLQYYNLIRCVKYYIKSKKIVFLDFYFNIYLKI